jgi:hypothetical protein
MNKNEALFEFPMIVIVPQETTPFSAEPDNNNSRGFQRSIKIYDGALYKASTFSAQKADIYFDKLECIHPEAEKLKKAISMITMKFAKQLSPRLLKFCLRDLEQFMATFPHADPAVAMSLIMSRYIYVDREYGGQGEYQASNIITGGRTTSKPVAIIVEAMVTDTNHEHKAGDFNLSFSYDITEPTYELKVYSNPDSTPTGNLVLPEYYRVIIS